MPRFCPKGHDKWLPHGIYIIVDERQGHRKSPRPDYQYELCAVCRRERDRKYRENKRAKKAKKVFE